jgi:hypothetical protein
MSTFSFVHEVDILKKKADQFGWVWIATIVVILIALVMFFIIARERMLAIFAGG